MSLRLRIIALVAFVLTACTALSALVVAYQVRKELATELEAAMSGARRAAAATFEDLPRSDHPLQELRQLVQTFDGNRHVTMALIAAGGRILVSSQPSDRTETPAWFSRIVEERLPAAILPVPPTQGYPLALLLTPTPEPDVHAAWNEGVALTNVVESVSGLGLILIWVVINVGLRPLQYLTRQFARLGAGDYGVRAVETGPPELRLLQRGFNEMTAHLESTMQRNHQLGEQLAQLQDEERAEIARDLHDEVGPRLFAIGLDAAMIAQLCEAGETRGAVERAREIQHAVAYVQGQVRDLLGWLRPARLTEFGLAAAIDDLVAFWAARRADIAFELTLPKATNADAVVEVAYRIIQEAVSNAVRHASARTIVIALVIAFELTLPKATNADAVVEVAYRIIQEAVSNAVRHASARTIVIALVADPDDILSVQIENDGFAPGDRVPTGTRGFGLIGMRERVEAQGGTLHYGPDASGFRWTVHARLPLRSAMSIAIAIDHESTPR